MGSALEAVWDDLAQYALPRKMGKKDGVTISPIRHHAKNGTDLNVYKNRLQPGTRHQSVLGYNGDRYIASTKV